MSAIGHEPDIFDLREACMADGIGLRVCLVDPEWEQAVGFRGRAWYGDQSPAAAPDSNCLPGGDHLTAPGDRQTCIRCRHYLRPQPDLPIFRPD